MSKNNKENKELLFYKSLMDSISDVIFFKDLQGRYVIYNKSFLNITKLKKDEVQCKDDFDIWDEKTANEITDIDKKIIKTKKPIIKEQHLVNIQGEKMVFEAQKVPIFDENNDFIGIAAISRNITQQKKDKEELIANIQKQKAILDNLPFMAWIKDKESKYIYVNEPFRKLCNRTLDEMIGKTDLDFFPKELANVYRKDDFEIMKTKKNIRVEEPIQTQTGKRWFETYKMPLLDTEEEATGTTGFARDITDEKKAKEELKESFEKQKAILDNLPFGAWLKDKDSVYIYSNEPFSKLSGNTPQDLIGKIDNDFFPDDLADAYRKDDIEVMRTKKKLRIEESVQTPSGRRWYETYKTPLLSAKGDVIGTTGFTRDITEQKKLELIKNEFLNVVSKELKTPLSSIKGSIQLILSGAIGDNLSSPIFKLLNIAQDNATRLIHLVDDILDIENIEKGQMSFNFKPYSLMELIKESIEQNQDYIDKFNLNISLLECNYDIKVKVDKARFLQVMKNLIINAVNFSPQNSTIDISIIEVNSYIRISIKDYGPGIPEDKREIIFHKFAQEDIYDKEAENITGLGLSLSKSILKRMQGFMDFETKKGKGTTFYFDIPKYQD